jgi:hypothetical protein
MFVPQGFIIKNTGLCKKAYEYMPVPQGFIIKNKGLM